jgi:hypothetical protein
MLGAASKQRGALMLITSWCSHSQQPAVSPQRPHDGKPASNKLVSKPQQQSRQAGHVRFVDSDAEEAQPSELADHHGHANDTTVPQTPAQRQAAVDDTDGGYNAQPWDYSRQQERRQKRAGQRHTASVVSLQPTQVVLWLWHVSIMCLAADSNLPAVLL